MGQCHRLRFADAAQPTGSDDARVACRQRPTSLTVKVAPLDLVRDGHLLSPDSDLARERLARTCGPRLLERAGGDQTTRRLSRLQVVWFTPTAEEIQAGADWVRCDVVAVRSEGRLLPLPPRLRGLLDRDDALDTYGTCGTASPQARGFRRVACAEPYSWRAVDVVELPRNARFLADGPTADADAACRDIAARRAADPLELTWAFEWPTRAQWDAGQRWGWCWVPA